MATLSQEINKTFVTAQSYVSGVSGLILGVTAVAGSTIVNTVNDVLKSVDTSFKNLSKTNSENINYYQIDNSLLGGLINGAKNLINGNITISTFVSTITSYFGFDRLISSFSNFITSVSDTVWGFIDAGITTIQNFLSINQDNTPTSVDSNNFVDYWVPPEDNSFVEDSSFGSWTVFDSDTSTDIAVIGGGAGSRDTVFESLALQ